MRFKRAEVEAAANTGGRMRYLERRARELSDSTDIEHTQRYWAAPDATTRSSASLGVTTQIKETK